MVKGTTIVPLTILLCEGVSVMLQVNVKEAKTDFSRLIRLIEGRREDEITVARNGKPVARIVPITKPPVSKRIGVAKGKFKVPDDFDTGNEEIAAMLTGGEL